VNGFSTSLPAEIQRDALRTIPGLERAEIARFGYAVEYDYVPPYQLSPWLETRRIRGLFLAGQVNGTSGYEEAAAQGLIAGINAARSMRGEEPFVLDRSQGYIGVLIDDLVNLSTDEPYRMFTSRAEYRLLLRRDNADLRLTPMGYEIGLVPRGTFDRVEQKLEGVARGAELLRSRSYRLGESTARGWVLLKRPEGSIAQLLEAASDDDPLREIAIDVEVVEQLEIAARYEGYIARQEEEIRRFKEEEARRIPETLDYHRIKSISSEGREKLSRIRPRSLGQASRISGVSRSDLAVLTLYLR
jgi:tRNA uridine 5-carboxymethylaminomethyl modification enzyme